MLTILKSSKDLPYKLWATVLLPNDVDIKALEDIEGCLLITKSPKMTILFLEYQEGQYNKVSKEIWNHVQYISKNEKKQRKINGKGRKI